MKKKVIQYSILFLLVPLIVSLAISIRTNGQGLKPDNNAYDGMDIPSYNNQSETDKIKRSSTYIYTSLFIFTAAGGIALIYIKKKRGI